MDNDKSVFIDDFTKMNKELKPLILDFKQENDIHIKPFLFFFAAIIKESLKFLKEDKQFEKEFSNTSFDKFKESIILFILGE